MRIGIDIDGVLTDIEQWQLDYGNKFIFEKYHKGIINSEGYDIEEIFNVDKKAEDEFWEKYLYEYARNEPARKFASEIINKLKDDEKEIYIITARYLTNGDHIKIKIKIEKQSGNINVINKLGAKEITLISDTGKYEDTVYVEGMSYYLVIKTENFVGNIDIISE